MQIVFLPGFLCDARLFAPVRAASPALASAPVADFAGAASMGEMAQRALAAADGPLALVGHSMGAAAALEASLRSDRVRALLLVSANSRPDAPADASARLALAERAQAEGVKAVFETVFAPRYWGEKPPDARVTETMLAMAIDAGSATLLAQTQAIARRADPRIAAARFAGPLRVVTGARDIVTPPERGKELAAAAPQGRFEQVEGVAHLPPFEAPALIARLALDLATEAAQA